MTKDENAELDSLLDGADSKPITKDEAITIYKLIDKRIREIEQKAINKLSEQSKKNKSNPEDNSADPDTVRE